MRLSPVLLALTACSTVTAALRAPWLERVAYDPARRLEPTKTHSAPQKRASAGLTQAECEAEGGTYLATNSPPLCSYYAGDTCLTGTREKTPVEGAPSDGSGGTSDPAKRLVSTQGGQSPFWGEVLDARHAVKFLLSETGSYEHDNGTIIHDPIYYRKRQAAITRSVGQGLISRWAAQSLSAFVRIIPRSYIDRGVFNYLTQKNTLFVISPLTAFDMDDVPNVVDLILAEPDWTSFTLGAVKVERDTIEFLRDVLANQTLLEDA